MVQNKFIWRGKQKRSKVGSYGSAVRMCFGNFSGVDKNILFLIFRTAQRTTNIESDGHSWPAGHGFKTSTLHDDLVIFMRLLLVTELLRLSDNVTKQQRFLFFPFALQLMFKILKNTFFFQLILCINIDHLPFSQIFASILCTFSAQI